MLRNESTLNLMIESGKRCPFDGQEDKVGTSKYRDVMYTLLADLSDRRGVGQELSQIDDSYKMILVDELTELLTYTMEKDKDHLFIDTKQRTLVVKRHNDDNETYPYIIIDGIHIQVEVYVDGEEITSDNIDLKLFQMEPFVMCSIAFFTNDRYHAVRLPCTSAGGNMSIKPIKVLTITGDIHADAKTDI